MKKLLAVLATLIALVVLAVAAGGFWLVHEIRKPQEFIATKEFMVPKNMTGYTIGQKLYNENLIDQPLLFYFLLRLHPAQIKAGEYAIPPQSSLEQTISILGNGETIKRDFTLAEGLTVKQAIELLKDNEYLVGDITTKPDEGTLLPETYEFIRNDTRDSVIKKMQDADKKYLDEAWPKRDPSVPLKSINEAVTLASVVEKETGKPEERPRIAGLFYNRLKINMPLQSDPTVVYVITDHLGSMQGKPLYSKDLAVDSPFNTYKNPGLPPSPIANPGRASIEAVLHPETNEFLYFVANGTGGHVFAKDLKEHNKNVTEWRKIKKEQN
jgi:UPF0755 protein